MSKTVLYGSIALFLVGGVLFIPFQDSNLTGLKRFVPGAMLSLGAIGALMSLSVRRILGARCADRLFVNLSISLMAVSVMLVLGEFAVRISFQGATTSHWSYFSRVWPVEIRRNSWGFREREFDLAKPEGVYRIAVVGDSITFGQGVEEENRFTNLLEKRLNDQNGEYEVLNFGRPGAETVDHLDILNDPVLKTESDFILLQWFTNDFEGRDKSGRPNPPISVASEIRHHSALFTVIDIYLRRIQPELGWVDSYQDYMLARFGDPNSPSSLAAEQALQEFVNITKEQELPLGIVLYINHTRLEILEERVLELCERESIMCLHLGSIWEPYGEISPPQLWAGPLDPHPGALAHSLIADRLMDTYGEVWLSG